MNRDLAKRAATAWFGPGAFMAILAMFMRPIGGLSDAARAAGYVLAGPLGATDSRMFAGKPGSLLMVAFMGVIPAIAGIVLSRRPDLGDDMKFASIGCFAGSIMWHSAGVLAWYVA